MCLKADLERDREEKKLLQLQRDHMLGWRGTVEEKLEEAEAKLRNICKEKQEAEERHQVEISVSLTQTHDPHPTSDTDPSP